MANSLIQIMARYDVSQTLHDATPVHLVYYITYYAVALHGILTRIRHTLEDALRAESIHMMMHGMQNILTSES